MYNQCDTIKQLLPSLSRCMNSLPLRSWFLLYSKLFGRGLRSFHQQCNQCAFVTKKVLMLVFYIHYKSQIFVPSIFPIRESSHILQNFSFSRGKQDQLTKLVSAGCKFVASLLKPILFIQDACVLRIIQSAICPPHCDPTSEYKNLIQQIFPHRNSAEQANRILPSNQSSSQH